MLLKWSTQYIRKFGKLSSGYRTAKGQFSFQSQRRAMPKNVNYCTMHSFCMLVRLCSKSFKAKLQQYLNWEFPVVYAGFRKGRGTRDQIANIHWIIDKERKFQKNIYFCFIDYAKAFNCEDHKKLQKIWRDGNTKPTYLSPEKPVCTSRSNS